MAQTDKKRLTMGAIEENLKNNEKEHTTIMTELTKVSEEVGKISVQLAKLPQDILDLADKRYASKTAERVIYGLVGAVCLAFVLGLWELIKSNYVVA